MLYQKNLLHWFVSGLLVLGFLGTLAFPAGYAVSLGASPQSLQNAVNPGLAPHESATTNPIATDPANPVAVAPETTPSQTATPTAPATPATASQRHIYDDARIFSPEKISIWNQRAAELAKQYGIGIYIVTTSSLNGRDPRDWTIDYFRDAKLGEGSQHSGEILMICPESRDMHIGGQGEAEQAFPNYVVDVLLAKMRKPLRQDDWDGGGELFLQQAANYLRVWKSTVKYSSGDTSGREYSSAASDSSKYRNDYSQQSENYTGIGILTTLVLAAGIAGLVMWTLWAQHNTIKRQQGARYYVVPGSSRITNADDILVDSYVTSVKIPKASSSSSSRSSFSSGGWTGGSSKF